MITGGNINIGIQTASAQSMGSEIIYYPCEDYSTGQYHLSTTPCNYTLPEVTVCQSKCEYCQQWMSCESKTYHTCPYMPQYNNYESQYPYSASQPYYPNNVGGGGGGGGGGTSSAGGSSSSSSSSTESGRDSRDYGLGVAQPYQCIDEEIYEKDLNDLLNQKIFINQGNAGTCGAAVLEKFLMQCYPELFNSVAKDLYQSGHSHTWDLQLNKFSLSAEECRNLGFNTVDALFQTTIIQENNYNYTNYELNERSKLKESTYAWRISDFIQNHVGNRVETINAPSYDQIQNALYNNSNIFVIGFVEADNSANFVSNNYLIGNHYVQITNATGGSQLEYYSDGKLLISNNSNICTLYIVKRK